MGIFKGQFNGFHFIAVLLATGMSGCFSIRSIEDASEKGGAKNYTVITSKNDGCTGNTLKKTGWTTGLQLLCQTSQTVGTPGAAAASGVLAADPSGSKNYCWIALSDKANEGRKVFCNYKGDIIKLHTDSALDIPEQSLKANGTKLFFFGRKSNSKFVVYKWNWEKVTEIAGTYNGDATW